MATIDMEKLVYSKKESSPNICPVCGSEPDYEALEVLDASVVYPWECKSCGAKGKEFAKPVFDGHIVEIDTLPPAAKKIYQNM